MTPNPFSDVFQFLTQPAWTTVVYWLLLLGSIAVAARAWRSIPAQRSGVQVVNWLCRFFVGTMWWQQTLWKLPPLYTDNPSDPLNSGLHYWMNQLGQSAWLPLQAGFVNHVVIPHFYLFAPIVYVLEVLTGVSLILGLFVPLWGLIGVLQVLNLWLGLYHAPGEWPWTYFFLLVLMVSFTVNRSGRSLGLDAIIVARRASGPKAAAPGGRWLERLT